MANKKILELIQAEEFDLACKEIEPMVVSIDDSFTTSQWNSVVKLVKIAHYPKDTQFIKDILNIFVERYLIEGE